MQCFGIAYTISIARIVRRASAKSKLFYGHPAISHPAIRPAYSDLRHRLSTISIARLPTVYINNQQPQEFAAAIRLFRSTTPTTINRNTIADNSGRNTPPSIGNADNSDNRYRLSVISPALFRTILVGDIVVLATRKYQQRYRQFRS